MAGRVLNRRELREQADHAEPSTAVAADAPAVDAPPKKKSRAKTPGVAKVRKPRAKKAPPRMRARWGIFDGCMKQVAIFDYNERALADEKLADLRLNKKGSHFMQIVKEVMPEPVVVEVAAAE